MRGFVANDRPPAPGHAQRSAGLYGSGELLIKDCIGNTDFDSIPTFGKNDGSFGGWEISGGSGVSARSRLDVVRRVVMTYLLPGFDVGQTGAAAVALALLAGLRSYRVVVSVIIAAPVAGLQLVREKELPAVRSRLSHHLQNQTEIWLEGVAVLGGPLVVAVGVARLQVKKGDSYDLRLCSPLRSTIYDSEENAH